MNKKTIAAITVAAVLGLTGTVINLSKDSNVVKYGFEPTKAQTAKTSESVQEVTTFFQELEQKSEMAGLICGQHDGAFDRNDKTFIHSYGSIIDFDMFNQGYEKGYENVQKIKSIKAVDLLEDVTPIKLDKLMQNWEVFAKKWGFDDIQNMGKTEIKSLLTGIVCGQYDGMYFDEAIVPSYINEQYQESKDQIDKKAYEQGYQKGFSNISQNRSYLTGLDKQQILSELTITKSFWNNQESEDFINKKKI